MTPRPPRRALPGRLEAPPPGQPPPEQGALKGAARPPWASPGGRRDRRARAPEHGPTGRRTGWKPPAGPPRRGRSHGGPAGPGIAGAWRGPSSPPSRLLVPGTWPAAPRPDDRPERCAATDAVRDRGIG